MSDLKSKYLLCFFWTIKEAYCKYTGKGLIQILSDDIKIDLLIKTVEM